MILPSVPGITPGIPFAEYLKLPGLSASKLKTMARSPLAFAWNRDHPDSSASHA